MQMRALLTAAVLAATAPAFAQTKTVGPEVQKHFDLGNDLYNEGRYEDALVEYEKAYTLSSYWKILYNRGQALVMLRREPDAIADFTRYLEEGGSEIPDDRRRQVEADLEKLKRRIAYVALTNAPTGLEVTVDGRSVATTPLARPLSVGAGKHAIALRRGGVVVFARDLQIPAGESLEVPVEIAPEPKKVEAPPVAEEGGLAHPAFPLSLAIGVAAPMRNVTRGRIDLLAAIDVGGLWRPHPVWSIGLFLGGAAGKVELADPQEVDSKASYSYGIGGLRTRLHLLRDHYYDGWLGLDLGIWRETWKFNPLAGDTRGGFEWAATSPAFGIAGGIDFPLSRSFALGGAARLFGTFVNSGDRVGCGVGDERCARSADLPGGGGQGLRGFFEVTGRLTYSVSYGGR